MKRDAFQEARNGSEAAFLQLFDEHHVPLFRFAYRLTGSVSEAEDVVQECFLELLRPGCSYDPRRMPTPVAVYPRSRPAFAVSSGEMERLKKIRSSWPPTIGVISGCGDWTCRVIEHYYHQRVEAGGGTSCLAGEVVGRETILNYPTAAVQVLLWDRRRTTLWVSPDLGCFALRITIEVRRPDGSFHLVDEKQALKVTLNH